jgi:hypothetical protein
MYVRLTVCSLSYAVLDPPSFLPVGGRGELSLFVLCQELSWVRMPILGGA